MNTIHVFMYVLLSILDFVCIRMHLCLCVCCCMRACVCTHGRSIDDKVVILYSIQEESLTNIDVEKELLPLAISTNRSMDRIFPNDQVSLVSTRGTLILRAKTFISQSLCYDRMLMLNIWRISNVSHAH